jgi:predicted AAA+ superfamily ATPase
MRAVELSVDRDRQPGCFLLTGSASLLQLRTVGESLAGRSAWVEPAPMTWSEIRSQPSERSAHNRVLDGGPGGLSCRDLALSAMGAYSCDGLVIGRTLTSR